MRCIRVAGAKTLTTFKPLVTKYKRPVIIRFKMLSLHTFFRCPVFPWQSLQEGVCTSWTVSFHFDQHSALRRRSPCQRRKESRAIYMQLQINSLSSTPAITSTWLDPWSQTSYPEVSKNPKYHHLPIQLCLWNPAPTLKVLLWGHDRFQNL